ncbi:MAG: glycogen/starch synthase [Candidatus Altiarchaeota archaeon]
MVDRVVFEVSYEVCNKIGGIYAVLKSKAARMVERYGENYYAVGFYDAAKSRVELDHKDPPQQIGEAFKQLESTVGIRCHYGIWGIEGKPKVILVDSTELTSHIDEIKAGLWERYQVDSITSDAWFNDPLVWATACGMVIEALVSKPMFADKEIVVQCHEWMSGAPIMYFKDKGLKIPTVFTTHATILGRSIAGQGVDLYKMVNEGLKEGKTADLELAKKFKCLDKHTMEVACAREASVFTTVSEITSKEAHFILGRKVDIAVLNGLDISKYPDLEELPVQRRKNRMVMRQFLTAYFNRYYNIDFNKIRSMFISGRYEYHNKGIDLFIQSLRILNEELKKKKFEKTVIVFFFIPSGTKGENIDVLKNISLYEEMTDRIEEETPVIRDRIAEHLTRGEIPATFESIVDEEFIRTCKNMMVHFTEKKGGTPPLCAFDLSYPEGTDSILSDLRANGLLNREEDKVKVIFYPAYLSSAERLIPMGYNEATLTCDIGVFPSYYEPWGLHSTRSRRTGKPYNHN